MKKKPSKPYVKKNEFVIWEEHEPPKVYVDSFERTRTIEFVIHTTAIREVGGMNEKEK